MAAGQRLLVGKKGRVTVNAVNLAMTGFTITPGNEKQDGTNSESGGAREYIAGLDNWSGSVSCLYDAKMNPHASPPAIVPGTIIPGVQFIVEAGAGVANATYEGDIFVDSVPVTLAVEGRVEYTINFTGNGPLILPAADIDTV